MVTAGMSEIGTVTVPMTGQAAGQVAGQVMPQGMGQVTGQAMGQVMSQVMSKPGNAADPSVMTGNDASVFAQLLSGLVGDEPQALPAVASGAVRDQSVDTKTDADASNQTQPSADLLALCSMVGGMAAAPPMAPPVVTVDQGVDKASANVDAAVGSIATDAAPVGRDTSNVMPSNTWINAAPVMPQASLENAAPDASATPSQAWLTADGAGSAPVAAPRSTDMQWLHANGHTDTNKATGTVQVNTAATKTDAEVLEPSMLSQDTASASPEQQNNFQKLLTQATPMVAMLGAQLREARLDDSARDVAASDAQSSIGALNGAQLQPTGTQLASDTPLMDVAPRHHVHAQVGTQQWATELGNKLTLLASKDTQSATLYMTPADLGPVQVRIDMNQDQASVWFTAEHAETRSALEQSLPKLRELFTAQGMSLTDAGVFGDRSRQQHTDNHFTSTRFVSSQYEDGEALADTAMVRSISLSLLDAYA